MIRLAALLAAAVPFGPAPASTVREAVAPEPSPSAEQLFEDRLDPERLDAALAALARRAKARPGDAHARILLARAEAFWSDLWPDAAPELADAQLREGLRAAGEALALLSPGCGRAGCDLPDALGEVTAAGAEALYWFAADRHRLAARHGLAWLLLEDGELERLFRRVVELAPATYHGGAERHLAELALALPFGFGPGLAGAATELATAEKLGPTFLPTRIVWAQRLAVKAQDYPLFLRELRAVLDAPPDLDPEAWPENELARRRARELSVRAEELFTSSALHEGR